MSSTWAPFNGKPTSLQLVTANYTVPVGFYARVSVNCRDGGAMSLNGTTVMASGSWSVLASSPMKAALVDLHRAGSGAVDQTGYIPFNDPYAEPTGNTYASAASGVADAFTSGAAESSSSESYWVPSGTVIAVSGGTVAVAQIYQG